MKDKMEVELNETLNRFEHILLAAQDRMSAEDAYKLKSEYIDLKYDFIKYLLRAFSPLRNEKFDFEVYQDLAKASSPMLPKRGDGYTAFGEFAIDKKKIN